MRHSHVASGRNNCRLRRIAHDSASLKLMCLNHRDNRNRRGPALVFLAGLLWTTAGVPGGVFGATPAGDAAGLEFFEKHVRPVLVEHCYKCHSAASEKLRGSLRLDTREGMLKGGDSGPAIVPGDPDKSLLIKAVRHASEDLKMPVKNPKLPDEQIEELAAWIRMGAPDPRTEQVQGTKSTEARRLHWAFQPVREPVPPSVRNKRLVQTPVDNF